MSCSQAAEHHMIASPVGKAEDIFLWTTRCPQPNVFPSPPVKMQKFSGISSQPNRPKRYMCVIMWARAGGWRGMAGGDPHGRARRKCQPPGLVSVRAQLGLDHPAVKKTAGWPMISILLSLITELSFSWQSVWFCESTLANSM